MEKFHHQIRLRILSCSRVSENHRGPEVPEVKVPVVQCIDGLARITSKELAITHFVKSGTLQNACSTRLRVVVGLGKSCSCAHRQVDEQPTKRSKKNDDKSSVAMLKKDDWHDRAGQSVVNHDKSHDVTWQHVVKRDTRHELNHGPVGCRSSNARQLGCVFSGHGAAEVVVNLTEELRHAETNPTCKIHESYCTSQ